MTALDQDSKPNDTSMMTGFCRGTGVASFVLRIICTRIMYSQGQVQRLSTFNTRTLLTTSNYGMVSSTTRSAWDAVPTLAWQHMCHMMLYLRLMYACRGLNFYCRLFLPYGVGTTAHSSSINGGAIKTSKWTCSTMACHVTTVSSLTTNPEPRGFLDAVPVVCTGIAIARVSCDQLLGKKQRKETSQEVTS
jgi:hypothetical protein